MGARSAQGVIAGHSDRDPHPERWGMSWRAARASGPCLPSPSELERGPHLFSPGGEGGGGGGGGGDSECGGEDGESDANGDDGGKDGGGGAVVGRDTNSCASGGCACAAKIKNIKQYLPLSSCQRARKGTV